MQTRIDEVRNFLTWGWLLMATYMGGMPGNKVGRCLAMTLSTLEVTNVGMSTIAEARQTATFMHAVIP
jgi:hypothetical protein